MSSSSQPVVVEVLEIDVLGFGLREEGLRGGLYERPFTLWLRQPVHDDRVPVEQIVVGPLLMPAFAEAPVGLKVLLDYVDGGGHFDGGFAFIVTRAGLRERA
jgi:hypothetical protein